jgi:hypothetical protein
MSLEKRMPETLTIPDVEKSHQIRKPIDGASPTAEEAHQIGIEAYVYFYPLVTMDVTRRVMTNVPPGLKSGAGPMNQFSHIRTFPTADFKDVVRPNFDTLYSSGWLDLTKEPAIVSAPDTAGRYYLLPMMDMWTDVFAAPGKRTSGTSASHFAVVPPGWQGRLPDMVQTIQSPTRYVWIIGRTQTNGPKDYEAVHKVQDGYRITPLSQWGKRPVSDTFKADPFIDMKTPPMKQVNTMPGRNYFAYASELIRLHAPHLTDWSLIARLSRIGIVPGKSFESEKLDSAVLEALTRAAVDGLTLMYTKMPTLSRVVNGWQMNTDTMGVYGNYYLKRAIVALVGLGANLPEDAVYPISVADANGQLVAGENKYLLHFEKVQLPPAQAFWSLTMYDGEGFPVANPISRCAIGDRDDLKYNADGSLDLYIQHQNPGPDKVSNWLPSPAKGPLGMTMRLYAPKTEVLDGRWAPPPLQRV